MFENMFKKISIFFLGTEEEQKYRKTIHAALEAGTFNPSIEKSLLDKLNENNLTVTDVKSIHESVLLDLILSASNDNKISDIELAAIKNFMQFAKLKTSDIGASWVDKVRRYYGFWLMEEKNTIPLLNNSINIILKKNEHILFSSSASSIKHKTITTKIAYGGLTASIKIAKGIRYRLGSLDTGRETKEVTVVDDTGTFFITSQRIGFIGDKKHFTINIDKILTIEVQDIGLTVRKDGRESPYIIAFKDYELACCIISRLLNDDYQLIDLNNKLL